MKKTRNCKWLLINLIGLILITSGCTKAIPVTYNADMDRLSGVDALSNLSLGIAKFDDKRTWVDQEDAKSESYIGMQSPWKFGMSYQNKDYIPVKDLVQTIFIKEFINAGISAKPIDHVLSKKNITDIQKLNEQNKSDYILGGEVLIFEFVNDAGVWTVTSRRSVALNLIMVKVDGEEVRYDVAFNETDREFEGMGVLHSTNVDVLMNKVFKKVIKQVVQQVAGEMALNYNDITWNIAINGKTYDFILNDECAASEVEGFLVSQQAGPTTASIRTPQTPWVR
jgi:hypothetical protein